MNEIGPRPGDWVSFYSESEHRILIGYVLNRISRTQNYAVFVPRTRRYYTCPWSILADAGLSLEPADIEALIDLALDLKDEVWFYELIRTYR